MRTAFFCVWGLLLRRPDRHRSLDIWKRRMSDPSSAEYVAAAASPSYWPIYPANWRATTTRRRDDDDDDALTAGWRVIWARRRLVLFVCRHRRFIYVERDDCRLLRLRIRRYIYIHFRWLLSIHQSDEPFELFIATSSWPCKQTPRYIQSLSIDAIGYHPTTYVLVFRHFIPLFSSAILLK